MSPALVPKPKDWRNNVDVVGFYFLDLATEYEPSPELADFLSRGPPPIYVGFGSVVVDDPIALSKIIFEATAQAHVRVLLSSGWGGLGSEDVPPHVFMLGNIPHDWLFSNDRVAAVVHHGGAGTTAIGIAKGRPTVIVPFFGDQAFWGDMVYRAGAGPRPIPKAELTVKKLRDAIVFALSASAKASAQNLADRIALEDGVRSGVASFYKHLPLNDMSCDLDPSRIAVWWSSQYCMKLSAFAAQVLADAGLLLMDSLQLHQTKSYSLKKQVSDPVPNGANAKFWTITHNGSNTLSEMLTSPIQKFVNTTSTIPTTIMKSISTVQERLPNIPDTLKLPSSRSNPSSPGHSRSSSVDAARVLSPPQAPKKQAPEHTRSLSASTPLVTSPNKLRKPPPPVLSVVTATDTSHDAWKSTQTDSSRKAQEGIRDFRIEQGKEAVRNSLEEERNEIISKFKREINFTPIRQKKYREEAEKELFKEMQRKKRMDGPLPPLPPSYESVNGAEVGRGVQGESERWAELTEEQEEEIYRWQLEQAIKQSLSEFRANEELRKVKTE
ncbi:glycosyltransferase family 28 domain-containing protein [Coprinopsis cinerea AmutBmut pab1-1]|nr:glycosyltransferase family 28 domain-containing protein [Coprinopsis cinerea AmutBmut pab1-1]